MRVTDPERPSTLTDAPDPNTARTDIDGAAPAEPEGPDAVADGARRGSSWRTASSWLITIAIAVVLTLVLKANVFTAYSIPSVSMVPTLEVGDRVIVNRLSDDPSRGDVIVFDRPANDPKSSPDDPDVLIKRVIGLPGDTVASNADGQVTVNDRVIDEPYLADDTVTVIGSPITVGADEVLVMGDNRPASQDGRVFGPIDRKLIVGRAIVRFWPLSRLGRL